jgi:hypothetical protein
MRDIHAFFFIKKQGFFYNMSNYFYDKITKLNIKIPKRQTLPKGKDAKPKG